MVYINLSEDSLAALAPSSKEIKNHAPIFSRFLSAMIDYFILSPVVAFFMVMFFRDSVEWMKRTSGSESHMIIVQLAIFALLLFTGLQSLFIYFNRATPGQMFLKLYLSFERKSSNLFFQIWFRQLGFVLSVLFLGFPFLAVLYHDRHRAFYDRLSESDVLSFFPVVEEAQPMTAFTIYETDKKYLATSISALLCFGMLVFCFSMLQSHDHLVRKVQLASLAQPSDKKCLTVDSQNQEERLKTVLALNILNLTSDDCTLSEADAVFEHLKIGQKAFNETKNISLAYFLKFYIGQKSADSGLDAAQYLQQACEQPHKTDLCGAVEDRSVASENETKKVSKQKLRSQLLEYIGKVK